MCRFKSEKCNVSIIVIRMITSLQKLLSVVIFPPIVVSLLALYGLFLRRFVYYGWLADGIPPHCACVTLFLYRHLVRNKLKLIRA